MRMSSAAREFKILCSIVFLAFVVWLFLPQIGSHGNTPIRQTQAKLGQIAVASQAYFKTYGSWPTGISNLFRSGNKEHVEFVADSPSAPNDAWHHPIQYQPFDATLGYGRVVSSGRDGKIGGSHADSDIEIRFTTNGIEFVTDR